MSSRTILLTGASGVLGRALLEKLPHHRVLCLTRRDIPDLAGEPVSGDVTAPELGLDELTWRRLVRDVDVVIHAAAVTDFTAGVQRTVETNVYGTKRVLELAAEAGADLHYVSTAFVARGDLLRATAKANNPADYLESKRTAEKLVRGSGIPATIVRPSVIIGDSRSGAIAKFQGLHMIALALLKNLLPFLPLQPEALVDFVPQDFVAEVVTALVDEHVQGGDYWVTAGENAVRVGQMVELGMETAGRLGLDVTEPRLVSPEMVDRLIRPVFLSQLPRGLARRCEDIMSMTALFAAAEPFLSTVDLVPGQKPISTQQCSDALVRSFEYLVRTKRISAKKAAA